MGRESIADFKRIRARRVSYCCCWSARMFLATVVALGMHLASTFLVHDQLVRIHLVAFVRRDFLDCSFRSLLFLLLAGLWRCVYFF